MQNRIYCKYCGAKLKSDDIGKFCPTRDCQWEHGAQDSESDKETGDRNG